MENSERDLEQATQIVYLKCLEKGKRNLILAGKKEPFSVKQLILASIDMEEVRHNLEFDDLRYDEISLQRMIKYSNLCKDDKERISKLTDKSLMWKVLDTHDRTNVNGFYGCVLKTSEENAVVAVRGSEGLFNFKGLIYDWIQSDLRSLNNSETIQTIEAREYAKFLGKSHILDGYKSIDFTGHSLGGQLCSCMAVSCAEQEETNSIYDRIGKVYSFDGQGVSNEYIEKHRDGIDKVASKITHFKWSPIGNLLYSFPGEKTVFLDTQKYDGKGGFWSKFGYYTLGKHVTTSLTFNKEGEATRGKKGYLAKKLENVSLALEQCPALTHSLYSLGSAIIGKRLYEKANGKVGIKMPEIHLPATYHLDTKGHDYYKIMLNNFINVMQDYTKTLTTEELAINEYVH